MHREGAARELINAMNQAPTMRIYHDLIRKMENVHPTTPISAKSDSKFTFNGDSNNGGASRRLKRDKIGKLYP